MTTEDTKLIFPVATNEQAAAQWRGQAVHNLLSDDGVWDRQTVEVEVRHWQGGRNQHNILVLNVVVTTAAAEEKEGQLGRASGTGIHHWALGGTAGETVEVGAHMGRATT